MKNKLTSEEMARLEEFIKKMLPWAHGHQIKSIATFVAAIIEKQTGKQAELARGQGNQEAATKRLSRLIHNERLSLKDFAEWLSRQVLEQLPRTGKVRVTIDWISEGDQHLLVISVVVGNRALPIFWVKLCELSFTGNNRHREIGWVYYNQSSPYRVWLTLSRARDKNGKWGIWYLVSNEPLRAKGAAKEYGRRFCCEEGFRDAKWYLGFAEARIKDLNAWSRMFALFAIALVAMTSLGMKLLVGGGAKARELLRCVASRRKGRCELSLISVVGALLRQDWSLLLDLSPRTKLNLEATL